MPQTLSRPGQRPRSDAAERLYVLWLVSTLLLVILIVIVTLLGTGHLRRQAGVINQQTRLIEQLSQRVAEAERLAAEARQVLRNTPAPATRPESPLAPANPDSRQASDLGLETSQPSTSPSSSPAADASVPEKNTVRTDDEVRTALESLLRPGRLSPLELSDRARAEQFLEEVRGAGEQIRWSGPTLARLAVLARLLGRDGPAEWFAVRAASAGAFPADYHEIAVRQLLDANRPAEASLAARRLLESGAARPGDVALLAIALAQRGDVAGADEALARLGDEEIKALQTYDRIRIAQALSNVEKWDRLQIVLATLSGMSGADARAGDTLRAILAIQRGRLAEALGMIDGLLEQSPDDYDLHVWRAVALLEAKQWDAARAELAFGERVPGRPEAWYWRGIVELRDQKPDAARPFLERSIAASQRYAPAWEALGTLAMILADKVADEDDAAARAHLDEAVQALARAVEANPRRASAHFLLAVALAKASQPAECAASLQAAFLLDRAWIESAKKTPVLERLLSAEEIDALAGPAGGAVKVDR